MKDKMKCYLCGCTEFTCRPGKVRDDENLEIFECEDCGLVFLTPNEKHEDLYENSGMHAYRGAPLDIDDWVSITERDDERRFKYLKEELTNKTLLDFGCGVGGFLLKARDHAHQVMGIELESRLQAHFKEMGVDVVQKAEDLMPKKTFDLITAFQVIVHLDDPVGTLKLLAKILKPGGDLIVEVPSSNDALLSIFGNIPFSEYTYWSVHRYLFSHDNLRLLAKKAELKLKYIRYVQRYPLSNHLYWLVNGKPGGHQNWSFLDSDELKSAYESKLASLGCTDTLIASFSH